MQFIILIFFLFCGLISVAKLILCLMTKIRYKCAVLNFRIFECNGVRGLVGIHMILVFMSVEHLIQLFIE